MNHLCCFSPDTIFTSLGFSQVLFEASHPHDLEVMVSGASATWLGIDVGCWLLGWMFVWPVGGSKETIQIVGRIHTHVDTRINTIERENLFWTEQTISPLTGCFQVTDISYTMMVPLTEMVLDGFSLVDSLMVSTPLKAPS